MKKIRTYLAGPIGDVTIKEARNWREYLRRELEKIGVEVLNPLDKYGKSLPEVRSKLKNWRRFGNVDAIRHLISSKIINQDIRMVEKSDFLTLWMPSKRKAEICGSYGEITHAFLCNIPVYIITERKLKPIKIPNWAIGCSTKIFKSWNAYLEYIKENWTDGKKKK